MLLKPGLLTAAGSRAAGDPILGLENLNHYSDPSLSDLVFHSGNDLMEILPIGGVHKIVQADPALAMEYRPNAFGGIGGYGFPQDNRWMMYDADPEPAQPKRTVGVVFSLDGSLSNDMIFGYAKFNAFNTSWRVQTNSNSGGLVNFGRDLNGSFPTLIPNATPGQYIMIIRQHSIDEHEFFINGFDSPAVVINPRDDYFSINKIRFMMGRIGTTRSEMAATIGPIFDTFSLLSLAKIKEIMVCWSARTGIPLS